MVLFEKIWIEVTVRNRIEVNVRKRIEVTVRYWIEVKVRKWIDVRCVFRPIFLIVTLSGKGTNFSLYVYILSKRYFCFT